MGEQITPVSPEVAAEEIKGWLDHKKISEHARQSRQEEIEELTAEITAGHLSIDENKNLCYRLKIPLEDTTGSLFLSELIFKPRLNSSQLTPFMKGVKVDDADSRLDAYICALTSHGPNMVSMGTIKKLDTVDKRIAKAISLFFL